MLQFNVVWCIRSRREIVLTIQSDNGKQGYKVGGKKYRRPKVSPFPEAPANGIAAIGFGEATNPELAAWHRPIHFSLQWYRRLGTPFFKFCDGILPSACRKVQYRPTQQRIALKHINEYANWCSAHPEIACPSISTVFRLSGTHID